MSLHLSQKMEQSFHKKEYANCRWYVEQEHLMKGLGNTRQTHCQIERDPEVFGHNRIYLAKSNIRGSS